MCQVGCVAKTGAAGGRVRDCGRSLLPSCLNQIRLSGVRYEANIILRCVRWYCSYPLSYRQLAEMVNERGMDVHHTTVCALGAGVWARIRQALPSSLKAN